MLTPGAQLIAVFSREDLDVHNDAVLAVRNTEGRIANLAGLFTEDGAQQALFGGQLGFALRRDLTDQNIAGVNLRTDTNDAAVVKVAAAESSSTFGMSRVISSAPSLVSLASISYSSIWMEV